MNIWTMKLKYVREHSYATCISIPPKGQKQEFLFSIEKARELARVSLVFSISINVFELPLNGFKTRTIAVM